MALRESRLKSPKKDAIIRKHDMDPGQEIFV